MSENSYGDYRPPNDFKQMTDDEMIVELLKFQHSIKYGEVLRALSSENLIMLTNALIRALEK